MRPKSLLHTNGWWRAGCSLSPHEIRLLSMLVEGHNLRTAAAELGVSRATVAWHMRNVYGKLQAHSKAEAVAKALRSGLIR
ncbi:MAG TPA: helix-turn-helix transcriptional regulator [Bryobacteraceae bacterium]|nr:helix-turn-helix transcriptional regulator [Bryobacteraceae bacterium]